MSESVQKAMGRVRMYLSDLFTLKKAIRPPKMSKLKKISVAQFSYKGEWTWLKI